MRLVDHGATVQSHGTSLPYSSSSRLHSNLARVHPFNLLRTMTQVKFDSELMKQLIPAVPIPATAHFTVVHDEQNRPMIFSIGNDGVFYLIKSGPDGKNQLVNLSSKFKLTTNALTFAVSEDVDHTIYLVFAEVGDGQGSHLHVMMPKKPSEVDWIGSTDLSPILLTRKGEPKPMTVQRLFSARYLFSPVRRTDTVPRPSCRGTTTITTDTHFPSSSSKNCRGRALT